jgi:hypothetical protein
MLISDLHQLTTFTNLCSLSISCSLLAFNILCLLIKTQEVHSISNSHLYQLCLLVVCAAVLVLLVPLVVLAILGLQVLLVLLVQRDQVDHKESEDHQAVQEHKVHQA